MSASRARRIGGRLAAAAVLSGLLLPTVSGLPSQAATAVKKPKTSWALTSTVNFSGSTLPKGCGAYTGKYTAGQSAWSGKDVKLSKGQLKLTLEKRTTSGQPYSSGAIGCWDWAQSYGMFVIKAQVPAGKGIDSYISLSPAKGTSANALTSLELLAPGPDKAYINNGYGTKSEQAQADGTFSGGLHTYAIEWAPEHLRMTVDGKEIFWSTNSFKGSRWISLVTSNGDALTGIPDAATTLPATFQIDSMKIYKYTGLQPPPGTVPATASPTPTPSSSLGAAAAGAGSASPGASAQPTAEAAQSIAPTADHPALAGGVWPWLLGGSLIAICAIGILARPSQRWPRRTPHHPEPPPY
jgi:beta-glucanase (GH16 family)